MTGAAERTSARFRAPGPGEAPLPSESVRELLERNARRATDRPAVRFEDTVLTHVQFLDLSERWATVLRAHRRTPFHVGVMLDNTPTYLAVLGGAALAGATVVGLNPTRRGSNLGRDLLRTNVGVVVTEPAYADVLAPALAELPATTVLESVRYGGERTGFGADVDAMVDASTPAPAEDVPLTTIWCLIFTSGTTADPKAVVCTHRRMLQTGERMRQLLEVTPDDVGYIAMPLFHSNALMVGWMPAVVAGATVALARRFSASRWLDDVRRHGATYFNYTGKPLAYVLATPARPDDTDNSMVRGFGNEGSPEAVRVFEQRFGVELIDAFGPTEGAIGIAPDADTPVGALGRAGPNLKVVDEHGTERPRARIEGGRLANADDCVGEIVNTAGGGPFEGYWNDPEANEKATRFGWYWTGDLGYVDDDGFLWFAGRTSDWLRVDGENFPAAPIERALAEHPDVLLAAVYAVPDPAAGDQVMAALVLRPAAEINGAGFAAWLDARDDIGPKWRPRYLRIAADLPRTATNKVLVRELQRDKFHLSATSGDTILVRDRGDDAYRPFTEADEAGLAEEFARHGRERFWEL